MFKRTVEIIDKVEDLCLITMFAGMVGIIFFQVIMRYLFNNSLSWSEELGKFLFVWISWLGISIGHRRQEHIKITLLVGKLPYRWQKGLEVISELLLIVICGVTLYYSLVMIQIQIPIPYAGIKISTAWGYLAVVLGCGLMIGRAVAYLLQAARCLFVKQISLEGGKQ